MVRAAPRPVNCGRVEAPIAPKSGATSALPSPAGKKVLPKRSGPQQRSRLWSEDRLLRQSNHLGWRSTGRIRMPRPQRQRCLCPRQRTLRRKEAASVSQSLSPGRARPREGVERNICARELLAWSPESAYQSEHALDVPDFRRREDMNPVPSGRELGTRPGGGSIDWCKHDAFLSYRRRCISTAGSTSDGCAARIITSSARRSERSS
jgi:hypothetical protein